MRRTALGFGAAAAVALPVLVGAVYALLAAAGLAGAGSDGFTTAHFRDVLADAATWRGVGWSIWIAAASTLLATAAAIGIAAMYRGTGLLDRTSRMFAALPLPVPHLVAAVLAVLVLGQSGLLARVAYAAGFISSPAEMPALVYDRWGIGLILAMTWKEIPFLSIIAVSLLATRGSGTEEAARTLGATPAQVMSRITLPLLMRGLLPAVVAVFVFVVGNYEMAVLMAPSDPLALPLMIEERLNDPDLGRRGGAYVLALLALGIGAVAVAAHELSRARWERLTA